MIQHRLLPNRDRGKEVTELNVTAFMNLMVVLVPFLLIIAVFSRITIHEMNLPAAGGDEPAQDRLGLQLEVIVRADRITVADRRQGELASFGRSDQGYDLAGLSEWLQKLKSRFPNQEAATILLEPKISYDDLIQVMDTVRVQRSAADQGLAKAELFPLISLGDAPSRPASGG